MYIIKTNH